MVSLTGKSAAGGPITVRLEPCGMAKARLVNLSGNPVAAYRAYVELVVTPGPVSGGKMDVEGRLAADHGRISVIDQTNYRGNPVSDIQGRIALPALIPGATYRIIDYTTARDEVGPQIRKEFSVKPGEDVELGDILIEKPQIGY